MGLVPCARHLAQVSWRHSTQCVHPPSLSEVLISRIYTSIGGFLIECIVVAPVRKQALLFSLERALGEESPNYKSYYLARVVPQVVFQNSKS
jgi:hypothetical protein